MILIPAIDIIDGRCVRLQQGDFARTTVYDANPVELAQQFEDAGCTRLHVVDLDGARQGRVVNCATIERVAARTSLVLDVGGGIRTRDDVARVFASGARYATIGSIAVQNSTECLSWCAEWGRDAFILGVDVCNGTVAIRGWEERTALTADELLAAYSAIGLTRAMCTDISRDGMLQGTSVEWYAALRQRHPAMRIIASGGVGSLADIQRVQRTGVCGVVVGRALYEGTLSLQEVAEWNARQSEEVTC